MRSTKQRFSEKPAGVINSSDLKTFKGQFVYWLFILILAAVCLVCVIPTIWTLCTGFKSSQEIYQSASFLPKNLTWAGIKESLAVAWEAMDASRASLNTLLISIGATVFTLVIDGFGGYVLSRLKPTGSKLMFTLIVWTMMMPSQIRTVPLFISYMNWPLIANTSWEVSLLNTYWPMILGSASGAFTVMLFKNNFDAISMSLVEAAKIDGAGNLRIFFNIMIPLSVPIIMYVAIGSMRGPWGDFFGPYLILTDQTKYTLPVTIYKLQSASDVKMNTYLLALVLSSIPGLLIFALFQKYIVGGVNVGGVKG